MNPARTPHDSDRPQAVSHQKLVVRVLQSLVVGHRFEDYASLADALKTQLATLRIRYDSTLVSNAIDELERGGQHRLVTPRPTQGPTTRLDTGPAISDAEARRILATLRVEVSEGRFAPMHPGPEPVRMETSVLRDEDRAIVQRLSALPETYALEYFWTTSGQGTDRLALLRQFRHVVIARPATWDQDALLRQGRDRTVSGLPCLVCARADATRRHFVIAIRHGGSLGIRNQAVVCASCEAEVLHG